MNPLNFFDYTFIDNKANRTLFLLHGTGGGKEDFLFLNDYLEQQYSLVGLKGNIDENGMTRFFKRLSPGVFDQDSIKKEAGKLQQFIMQWRKDYRITTEQMHFLGYSNGANMLLATLFYYPELLKNIILLHSMLPFPIEKGSLDLSGCNIFVSMGLEDPMVSHKERVDIVNTLQSCGAKLRTKEYQGGHEISGQEIQDVVSLLWE